MLVATDGLRCVVIPVELGEKDVAGYVSGDVLKAARKLAKNRTATVELNGSATLPNGATLPRSGDAEGGQFPNWKQVIPKEDYPHRIAFNAKFLYESGSWGAVAGAKAVLMPIRLT